MKKKFLILLFCLSILLNSCKALSFTNISEQNYQPITKPLPEDQDTSQASIRFLEDKIKQDPDDLIAYNMLGNRYLKRLRETGNITYLDLAQKAANESLRVFPAEQNIAGLALLTAVEYSSHEFTKAKEHAELLLKFQPNKAYPYQLLGDSLLELGEYKKAEDIFRKMEKLKDPSNNARFALVIRIAHLEKLKGNIAKNKTYLLEALNISLNLQPPSRESTAWCLSQLAESCFSTGDYKMAEKYYLDALTAFPKYFRAMAGLAQTKAAQQDLKAAIYDYEQVIDILPDLTFIASLADLYKLTGEVEKANQKYQLLETIAKLNQLNGVLYSRNLALFYANHNINLEQAYQQAETEYQIRKDIYGADALAWTAFKLGKLDIAQISIKEALKLGTKDAKIFYHAAMISNALGDKELAKNYLQQTLELNPEFDPIESLIAKELLNNLITL